MNLPRPSPVLFVPLLVACAETEPDPKPSDTATTPTTESLPTGDTGVAPGCDNGVQDADETDIDCGGSCDPCDDGRSCAIDDDCVSALCDDGICSACSMSVPCGDGRRCDAGVCVPLLAQGDGCRDDDACATGRCVDGVCCDDACEGPCLACSIGEGGQSDGVCTPAFVDVVEPGVCDATTGGCPGGVCACDDTGECVADFVVQVVAGSGHGCARTGTGAVKCWGNNAQGQLGLEDNEFRGDEPGEMGADLPTVDLGTGRTALALAAGGRFTCARLDDGTTRCWGAGIQGQLGRGEATTAGEWPGSMGDALPAVDLGTGRSAVQIFGGQEHACAILDDASLKCWGHNEDGELGLGASDDRGDEPGEMGDALPVVDLGTGRTARTLALGHGHSCAILDDGSVKCWGQNDDGELGLGDTEPRGDDPGEMGDALPAVDLGTGRTATAITAAGNATCAILDDGTVKCWGVNVAGLLGLGDTDFRGDEPGEMGDALPVVDVGGVVKTVTGRGSFFCARLADDTVKCWGANQTGQLGLGDSDRRGDDPGEMGSALPAVQLF